MRTPFTAAPPDAAVPPAAATEARTEAPTALDASALLDLWERGRTRTGPERALLLAGVTQPPEGSEPLDAQPLGRITARLLRVRTTLLGARGSTLTATTPCPGCAEPVEFDVETDELLALEDKLPPVGPAGHPPPLLHGEYEVRWRCPSYGDLVAVTGPDADSDPGRGVAALLERCVLRALRGGRVLAAGSELPEPVRAALGAAVTAWDPLADLLVDLTCPDARCGRTFSTTLDVGAFLWAELASLAHRLLCEVDALARAYGWSEAEVLALSEARRAAYLRVRTEGTP